MKSVARTVKRLLDPVFDLRQFASSVLHYGRYLKDLFAYRSMIADKGYNGPLSRIPVTELYPCLHDRTATTSFDHHYIYLNAWAFRRIVADSPAEHVDVGSQLSFITLLSSVVPVTFIDLRPADIKLSGLDGKEGTILSLPYSDNSVHSMSSLHVIEHIGLGRYGDPLDPKGTELAMKELARVISPGGKLYIGVPVSNVERIRFNADRVFNPETIIKAFSELGLKLVEFSYVDDKANKQEFVSPNQLNNESSYACGMFAFTREIHNMNANSVQKNNESTLGGK